MSEEKAEYISPKLAVTYDTTCAAPSVYQGAQNIILNTAFMPNVAATLGSGLLPGGTYNTIMLTTNSASMVEAVPVTVSMERYQEALKLWIDARDERDALKREVEQLRARLAEKEQ